MDKQYFPTDIEEKWVKIWSERKVANTESSESFSQVIPPPNVTGTLHMGHSFQYAIMDFYTRYNHMAGKDAYWQVGSDHAGIATQMLVENNLAKKEITRKDLGREKFLEEVWDWKNYSEEKITSQIKRLGSTVDWDKYRFTLDDGFNEAVIKAFVELHRKGKIYRGYRLVNWDPSLKTAVSDLEVVRQEKDGLLWHIKYPIEGTDDFITVATTRPETMFGDMAIAVNPDDKRYKDLIGKNIVLPFVGRKIPILADDYVDMEFGTGCLKITPGHDFNDYEIGKKYSLHEVNGQVETSETDSDFEPINIFNDDAWSNDNVPAPFNNLDRFKVRKLVIEKLSELSLLEKEEKYHISVPRGERSNVVIEPKLSHQWYVKTSEMAARANEAVNNGDIKFHPQNWDKTYFNWMDNIQDWCISRQIWWGHRIPAWYDTEGNVYVGHNEEEIRTQYNLDTRELKQDDDVLDTWFSSSLWPFASMGWPHETDDFKKHFPTSLLVTGFDIIFFWVARMMMMSLEFTDQIPFKDVYVTGLIRDENGQKMSKSKGNVIDPLDLIYGISQDALVEKRTSNLMQEKIAQKIERKTRNQFPKGIESYGTDALRMTFYSLATHTKDISFEFGRLKGYRNFCTKIWNAARFINGYPAGNEIFDPKTDADQLIMDEFQKTKNKIQKNIEDYRLDFAINEVYEFFWSKFCDVYIEECKKSGKTDNLRPMLKEILVMMHPFAPFITEEIHSLLFKSQIIE
ncbi:valine--tRNA ligase [Gammaproteobacteria bacterium]|mgnify:FL=1|nr:valine--tRNA ligase [Gammaproteobacteria bacterium]MDA7697121.1 valine--tRNA ligase [Gammaproteobacteria bacterium]MDA7735011.1 valine--tRNA ligase [Gammaproteobacteria bacterium]MDA7821338.1 valine--tRNA ligase [Gammaproteobacteria bacterium]MDA8683322.1 valine--tRNA ligase [Gammaproteobacteria bacterium]|tara:strand:+ start:2060 stop:4279 length:2220 start_codon:yes stop_codon:yes gene_type:complete